MSRMTMMTKTQCVSLYSRALDERRKEQPGLDPDDLRRYLEEAIAAEGLSQEDVRASVELLLLGNLEVNDGSFVEAALPLLSHRVIQSEHYAEILGKLILSENHWSHEDVAMELRDLGDPNTIECLFEAAQKKYDYLSEDAGNALARKCLFALAYIGTAEAWEKIRELQRSSDRSVSQWADEQLENQ